MTPEAKSSASLVRQTKFKPFPLAEAAPLLVAARRAPLAVARVVPVALVVRVCPATSVAAAAAVRHLQRHTMETTPGLASAIRCCRAAVALQAWVWPHRVRGRLVAAPPVPLPESVAESLVAEAE